MPAGTSPVTANADD